MATVDGEDSVSATLPFAGGVNLARCLVTEQYPDAELYDISCTQVNGQKDPVSDPRKLSQLTVRCRGGEGSISITDKGWWSHWAPAVQGTIITGNNNVGWDTPHEFGLEDAVEKLGTGAKFIEALLTYPQHPTTMPAQPYYKFTMASGSIEWVGVDGKVYKP